MDGIVERRELNSSQPVVHPGARSKHTLVYLNLLLRRPMDGDVKWKQLDKPSLVVFPGSAQNIHLFESTTQVVDGREPGKEAAEQPNNPSRPSRGSAQSIHLFETTFRCPIDGIVERKQLGKAIPSRLSPGSTQNRLQTTPT
jgi:hypothetical protein